MGTTAPHGGLRGVAGGVGKVGALRSCRGGAPGPAEVVFWKLLCGRPWQRRMETARGTCDAQWSFHGCSWRRLSESAAHGADSQLSEPVQCAGYVAPLRHLWLLSFEVGLLAW